MANGSMHEDLSKRVSEAIDNTLEPLRAEKERIGEAKTELQRELREVEAQEERIDRMIDAARLRKRAGRPPGTPRKQEPVPA